MSSANPRQFFYSFFFGAIFSFVISSYSSFSSFFAKQRDRRVSLWILPIVGSTAIACSPVYVVAESRLYACKTLSLRPSVRRSGGPRVHLLIGNNAHSHPSMLVVTPDHSFVDAKSASM